MGRTQRLHISRERRMKRRQNKARQFIEEMKLETKYSQWKFIRFGYVKRIKLE